MFNVHLLCAKIYCRHWKFSTQLEKPPHGYIESAQSLSTSLGKREYIDGYGTNIFANFQSWLGYQEKLPGTEFQHQEFVNSQII